MFNSISVKFILKMVYTLSGKNIEFFKEKGYLVIRYEDHQLFDRQAIQDWTKDIEGWERVNGKWMPYDEINSKGERQLLRVEHFMDYHDEYSALMRGPDISNILKQLNRKVSIYP